MTLLGPNSLYSPACNSPLWTHCASVCQLELSLSLLQASYSRARLSGWRVREEETVRTMKSETGPFPLDTKDELCDNNPWCNRGFLKEGDHQGSPLTLPTGRLVRPISMNRPTLTAQATSAWIVWYCTLSTVFWNAHISAAVYHVCVLFYFSWFICKPPDFFLIICCWY